jgi:hypothetical protein
MFKLNHLLIAFLLLCSSTWATQIETFYGTFEVEEPVLLELIESPAFQRLKHIHQYGVAYYTTHREEYSRYDHSLGVFFLLRAKQCSLEEQIAGLLHDVSHTVFSHVGDWIFNRQNQEVDYQTLTHTGYLEQSGLGEILNKHGYSIEEILPKQELFPALEQPLPTLCADRLDYNIQGAFHRGFITRQEAIRLFHEIQLIDGEWISNEHEILKKLVRYSLFMTQDCWGSGTNYVLSMWLADAILRGIDIGILNMEDVRFGTDSEIWTCLLTSDDPLIQKHMQMILNPFNHHSFVAKDEADLFITCKFRGIDPLVLVDGKCMRLTTIDSILEVEFNLAKTRMGSGWMISLKNVTRPNWQPSGKVE